MSEWDALEGRIVECRKCPRLVAWREEMGRVKRRAYRDQPYWARPLPAFGAPSARVLIVGLAPAAHGGNRTGRVFTGDRSGDFLYAALHRAGFANQPTSERWGDGLALTDAIISAVCRCAPPANKPTPQEIATCLPYLGQEIALLGRLQVVVALGRIAFDGVLRLYAPEDGPRAGLRFAHGTACRLGPTQPWLITSYHPSQQNTQTGRLTVAMFDEVWQRVRSLLSGD
jgi:uracil-DNA glycosylase